MRHPIDEVFDRIDPVPIGAASIGQVHGARLRNGTEVVVKIQRPAARAQVAVDLDIVERLTSDIERRTDWGSQIGVRALSANSLVP